MAVTGLPGGLERRPPPVYDSVNSYESVNISIDPDPSEHGCSFEESVGVLDANSLERILEKQHAKLAANLHTRLEKFLDKKLSRYHDDIHSAWSLAFLDCPVEQPKNRSFLADTGRSEGGSSACGASEMGSPRLPGSERSGRGMTSTSSVGSDQMIVSSKDHLLRGGNSYVNPKKADVSIAGSSNAGKSVDFPSREGTDATDFSKDACGSNGIAEEVEQKEETLPPEKEGILTRVVHSHRFDLSVGILVLLNVLLMFLQLEKNGYENGAKLDMISTSDLWNGVWQNSSTPFQYVEHFFNMCFLLELICRLIVDRLHFFTSLANVFDGFIVLSTIVDEYILKMLMGQDGGANLSFARMARLLKLTKFLRAFRVAVLFSELRVLIKTLISSMMALVWSAVLLALIMVAAGILMAQLAAGYIEDESAPTEFREWTFVHYGTGLRSTYTMFEATLSGGWPNYARILIEEVNPWFAVFWIFYVLTVVFAVIRVITALFLQKTMEAARGDEEMMVMQKMKEKETYIAKIKKILADADENQDGSMDRMELANLLETEDIQASLHGLGLEEHEVVGVFGVLDDGDGRVSHEEFIAGCMRITGGARAIDSVLIMHEQNKMFHQLSMLQMQIEGIRDTSYATAAAI